MQNGSKLIKVAEFPQIMAYGHEVEGTNLYIIEFLTMGFAHSSWYLLLRSRSVLTQLDDESTQERLLQHSTDFGKRLDFGRNLSRDAATCDVYYIVPVSH